MNGSLPQQSSGRSLSIADESVMLFADLQAGIADLQLTVPGYRLRANVDALARLATIFEIPVVVSTVPGRDGSSARVFPEIGARLGELTFLQRTTPDAFKSELVRGAIVATGRRTLIVAGVATEVAVQLACLTAAAAGYAVHVIVDCCAGLSPRSEDAALRRMAHAGVKISSLPALVGELAGDFAHPKGAAAMALLFELARAT